MGQGERLLDVGSGSGVPGVILKIVRPDLSVTLLDKTAKKARAMEAIVADLGLDIGVAADRVQEHLAEREYDTLVIRAVARLSELLRWLGPHWKAFNRVLLIKGPAWVDERGKARHVGLMHELELRRLEEFQTPRVEATTVVLEIFRKGTTGISPRRKGAKERRE